MASIFVMVGYIFSKPFIFFLVLQVLSGLGHALWILAYLAMVAERGLSDMRPSTLGKLSTIPQLFGIPGPYIGGVIYQIFGFGALMLIRVVALLLCFSIVSVFIDEG